MTSGTNLEVASDGTLITVTSPVPPAGKVNVTITAPGGTSAFVAVDKFTYSC